MYRAVQLSHIVSIFFQCVNSGAVGVAVLSKRGSMDTKQSTQHGRTSTLWLSPWPRQRSKTVFHWPWRGRRRETVSDLRCREKSHFTESDALVLSHRCLSSLSSLSSLRLLPRSYQPDSHCLCYRLLLAYLERPPERHQCLL